MLLRQMPCCTQLVIVICNFNSVTDDNFKVLLNGNEIGQIDNTADSVCSGRIWATVAGIPSGTITQDNLGAIDCLDATPEFEATIDLSATRDSEDKAGKIFVGAGSPGNMLRIESIQDNDHGNLGSVKVLAVQRCEEGGDWEIVATYLGSTYEFEDGIGEGQDYEFTVPNWWAI